MKKIIALFSNLFLLQFLAAGDVPQVEIRSKGGSERLEGLIIKKGSKLNEETPVGPNEQPKWTAARRFPTTRVYVLPPLQFEFEQWWKGKFPKEHAGNHLFQEEIGVGLPYRLQLDLYENWEITREGRVRHQGNQVEGRWALADWGRIPLNPTIYGEWKFNNAAPDACEIKLLLGEELAERWHWALNGFYEQETGGARTREWGWSQAISYSLIDSRLSLGAEMKWEHTTEKGARGNPEIEFLVGPSIQWRPSDNTHLDIVPLFGATHDSPSMEVFVVFGFDFDTGPKGTQVHSPASSRSR